MIPSTVVNVVTPSYYCPYNALISTSGRGFNTNSLINPDISTMGMNILTTKVAGGTTTLSGSSATTAIVVGACALLLEWGIVKLNNPYMYSQTIKTYIARGASKRLGDIYPNPQWGYGLLNILKMFQNMI
jgi:hypothetical protein